MTEVSMSQTERLLVCVGPSLSSTGLIRAAQKLAARAKAEWFAVYVESPEMLRLPEADRLLAVQNLRLAEQLGGETTTLRGPDIAAELVGFARQQQVTTIIIGKPAARPRWKYLFSKSPVDELVRESGDLEVRVITGEPVDNGSSPCAKNPPSAGL